MTSPLDGYVAPTLARVKDAFADSLANGDEIGAAFAVVIDGESVVDLRGGYRDRARSEAWDENALVCVFSSGKAVLSLLIARAVSEGRLDYEAPVAQTWPDFAAAGKSAITLGQAMSHQAGLCGFPEEMDAADWLDWERICARLAAMAPLWPPGTASGYHQQTVGFIAGELYRRAMGESVGAALRVLRREHGYEVHCGLGDAEIARAIYMQKPARAPDLGELTDYKRIAFLKPWSSPARVTRESWMAAEIPASNMHADARSLARLLQPFARAGRDETGAPFLDPAAVQAALALRISGDDLVLPFRIDWTAGLMRNTQGWFGPARDAYGHAGFGGSCVVIDPARRLTAAYVMNKMSPYLVGDPRAVRLLDATYAGLGM